MRSCQGMGIEKVRKDDTARTFEFLFRFNRVWINSRLLLLLLITPEKSLDSYEFHGWSLMEYGELVPTHAHLLLYHWNTVGTSDTGKSTVVLSGECMQRWNN